MFRIKFPKGWLIRDGDGPNVVKKAIDEINGSVIAILVKPYIHNPLTDAELNEGIDGFIEGMKVYDKNAQVLEKGIRYISYRKSSYAKARVTMKSLDQSKEGIIVVYSTFNKGKMYIIQASAPTEVFSEVEPILNASIGSFFIEDFSKQ